MNPITQFQILTYYLTDHSTIINFRWSPTQTWFSTWYFLITTIPSYILLSLLLNFTFSLFRHRHDSSASIRDYRSCNKISIHQHHSHHKSSPLLTLHSLLISLSSAAIFTGAALSAAAEITDNHRWLWRRTHLRTTPTRWLLCFPPGTRPTGRVFFWSYIFYLSRIFLHLPRTFLEIIIRRRSVAFSLLLHQSSLLIMSFLWLEFSQSFQVLAILLLSLVYGVVYGLKFWAGIGLSQAQSSAQFGVVVDYYKVVLLGCNLVCHVGVLVLDYFVKSGCSGMGAWGFNSVCNVVILLLFFKDFKKKKMRKSFFDDDDDDDDTMDPTMRDGKKKVR